MSDDNQPVIRFEAAVNIVRQMVDKGIRYQFDGPSTPEAIMAMAQLAQCKVDDVYLMIECRAFEKKPVVKKSDGRKRKAERIEF